MEKKPTITKRKNSRKKLPKIFELPSDNVELDNFIICNKFILTEHVVDCLEYALNNKEDFIQIFSFKDTKYLVTVKSDEYILNLKNIYDQYISTENYESCGRICNILNQHDVNIK